MTNYHKNVGIQPLKTFLARAIYDNLSENPTELNFSRGDLITVLDRNPSGLNGWWVCSIRGQLGIAPGNRLELLGLINNNKEQNNSDVYDDPTGWCIPNDNNNDSSSNNSKNSIVCTKKSTQFNPLEENHLSVNQNSCSLYENVDYYTKYPSSVGLTDSGNFSNQSSDVSFSIHSINDGIVDQRMNRENSSEDYEDLPPSIPEEFRDTNNSIQYELTSTNSYKSETILNNLHDTIYPSKQLNNEILFSLNTQSKSTDNIINSVDNLNDKKFPENVVPSFKEINNDKQFKLSLVLTPNMFKTMKEFTEYWLPIQERIHDKCLHLIKLLHQHDTIHSTHLITSLITQLNNEFIIISQLCTVMIGLSKQTTIINNNLTQKFIIYRYNMENLAELFIKLSKNINIVDLNNQYQKYNKQSTITTHLTNNNNNNSNNNTNSNNDSNDNNNNSEESKTLLEQTIQQLLTEINLFYTTILINSNLLFNNLINKFSESNQEHFSLIKQQTNMFNKLSRSIPSFHTLSLNSSLQVSNNKPNYLSKSYEFIDHLTNLNQKNLAGNLNFQKLSQFCLNSLNIIDNYLNYLIQFQNDTILYFKNLKNNNFFIQFIIEQTKLVMESCSQLIRYIMSICNEFKLLSSIHNINDVHDTNTVILRKLEYMTDKLCESLKGLIILTKEIAKFLTNEYEYISSHKMIPIPGPLLQRLNGALKSIQNSIKTIHELIKE
ncbi:unnamed protein product [Schistosoma mattheei]|uniref:Uncharacterized protein n=2 Tax=Schistosoma mattheei TaxID=31246 RepID=A0A183P2R3_9TREM|nr:unnamed protein product [Schistosoma mattheei]